MALLLRMALSKVKITAVSKQVFLVSKKLDQDFWSGILFPNRLHGSWQGMRVNAKTQKRATKNDEYLIQIMREIAAFN